MQVVVDANVLCAALLARGKTAELLFSEKIEVIAPELLFTELERHKAELLDKTKLPEEDFNTLLALFKKRVKIIPSDDFKDKLFEANEIVGQHTKDTAYIALALKFSCPFWSKEKKFKNVGRIDVLDAEDVEKRIIGNRN